MSESINSRAMTLSPICGPQPIPQPHRDSIPDRRIAVQQFDCVALPIARQLPLSPMMLFSRQFEHALDVTVQRPHDVDARAVQALPSGPMINQIAGAADHLARMTEKQTPAGGCWPTRVRRMDGMRGLGGSISD